MTQGVYVCNPPKLCLLTVSFFFSFFFYFQYWDLSSGPWTCLAGILQLEPCLQPLTCIFQNKTVIVYTALSWLLLFVVNDQIHRRCGNPWICSQPVAWGPQDSWLVSKGRQPWWGLCLSCRTWKELWWWMRPGCNGQFRRAGTFTFPNTTSVEIRYRDFLCQVTQP
jgi:hypothetical protein